MLWGNFLILYAEETILGTIPIGPGSNVTAFYTGDCMSFNETQNNIEKTVKIQLSGSQEDVRNFVFRIQQCINVSRTEEHDEISKKHKIAELLKNNPMGAITDVNPMLPMNYPLEDAVKLCLADPKFPALVENVSQVLKRLAQSGTQTGYEV
ncbi:uncharacterized protein LOC107265453 isoform X2 [Cephus cinctus]|uniref:Uncharacterized protein LOC107265453 isoform X2 n=1 Tax=Cephus cinctus TaxID=211228 RepID=A0AAJ7FGA8_CEPCN|nr:uncharacterized protein LOC107265453 isoform X2 [Cephus cinctus]